MKRTIIKWTIIVAVLVVAVFAIQTLRGRWIWSWQVQQIEFRGYDSCDAPNSEKIVLTKSESRKLLRLLRSATFLGRVEGEGCPSDFGFRIYLIDGTTIYAREAYFNKIEVNPPLGEKIWLKSKKLTQYAMELVEKYDLIIDQQKSAAE